MLPSNVLKGLVMAAQRHKYSQLSNQERVNILKCGFFLEELYGCHVKYAWIDRELRKKGFIYTMRTITKWWDRRDEFDRTGVIARRPNPKGMMHGNCHKSFNDPIKLAHAIEICEDLEPGEHQGDAANTLGCAVSTLRKHLRGKGCYKRSPRKQSRHTPIVDQNRVNFVEFVLTPTTHKVRKQFRNATFVDAKWVCFYGFNKMHELQYRQYGSKKPLRPIMDQMHNPKINCIISANQMDITVSILAVKRRKQRENGWMVDDIENNEQVMRVAVNRTTIPMMRRTNSNYVFMDNSSINHSGEVIQAFNNNQFNVHPTCTVDHPNPNGYPTYSPDVSILDGQVFGNLQEYVANEMKNMNIEPGENRKVVLFDSIRRLVRSDKMKENVRKAWLNWPNVLMRIHETGGGQIVT